MKSALKTFIVILAALFAPMAAIAQSNTAFKVGAAKIDSTPDQELCTGGYGIFCGWKASEARPNAVGGTDRMYSRALVVESEGQRVVIVTATAIGIFAHYKPMLDRITNELITPPGLHQTRLRIARETGMPSEHVFIQSDHSHHAPDTVGIWGGVPPQYLQKVQDDMVLAVKRAVAALEPAELFVASIDGNTVECVDPQPEDDITLSCKAESLYDHGPNLWTDEEFRILEARRPQNGKRIATFANYSPHATVLDDTGDGSYSGDWTGWLADMLDDDASGAIGLATVGTLGRTDFDPANNHGSGNERNLNRERAARARLNYFMDILNSGRTDLTGVMPFTAVSGSGVAATEMFLRETVTNPVFYTNHAPLVGVPQADPGYPNEIEARIDRSTASPWLTGTVLGTVAGAIRIGDLFFSTAPGEEFPNAQKCLRDGCDVTEGMPGVIAAGTDQAAPQMHFFLGATNDFLGYMGPAATYDQVVAQGATYFFCPPGDFERNGRETTHPVTGPAGYDSGRLFDEGSCPDHFVLMSSPTIGDHVNCSIQNAAQELGFGVEGRTPACDVLTGSDEVVTAGTFETGEDNPGSGQGGVAGVAEDGADDAQDVVDAVGAGDPEEIAGTGGQAGNNGVDNIEGVVNGDPDASAGGAAGNVADNAAEGDPEGAANDLVEDAENILLGFETESNILAGAGVVDMTPDVGYCAGQYCDTTNFFDGATGGDIDPFLTHTIKHSSYGVQSRLTARAVVVQGNNGKRVALIKTDNYLAQDTLMRRVAQLLQEAGSTIKHEQIIHSATHNHSSAYSSTVSWGVWIFEDVFDPRFFEFQARKIADAILEAEGNLQPARMGATTIRHKIFKGNVVRLATARDGTPAGYPLEYGDLGLVVMRFDALTESGPKPLAAWVNWGEHPESLDAHNLHTADFLGSLERYVDREIGAPLVFSQGDVGSAENSGDRTQMIADDGSVCGRWEEDASTPAENNCAAGEGSLRVWEHTGFAQYETAVRYLADDVVKGWNLIGANDASVQVPLSTDFPVDYRNYWAPGPLSHPYPGVSNCTTEESAEGDVGVPVVGLPDCGRFGFPGENELTGQSAAVYATMKAEGIPVPDHYDASAFTGVEENARIYLQAFRLGEVLLASCSCEAQVDLILNLESRLDTVSDNIYNGFDWACLIDEYKNDPKYAAACELQSQYYDPAEFPTPISGRSEAIADADLIAHMRAQIHNDARGWDAPEYAAHANSEPLDITKIKGNFTHEELPPQWGYTLPVGLGHSGDYVGYTVSYREYMNRDSYRKALTSYGPHTADYMVTRLVRMAGAMKGAPELLPEPHDSVAQADEVRQQAVSIALGQTTSAAYDVAMSTLPADIGPAESLVQPEHIAHFDSATFRWRGGNTQVDNPVVIVQQKVDGQWQDYADMTGEVQTRVHWPQGLEGVVTTYSGQFAWEWTANFEAYRAFPTRLGNTPFGDYRFVVAGCINDSLEDSAGNGQGRVTGLLPPFVQQSGLPLGRSGCEGGSRPYLLESESFSVAPHIGDIPRSYVSAFPFIEEKDNESGRDDRFCETCTFRPWATNEFGGHLDSDSDGVDDAEDHCATTPAGESVNDQGCSATERDSDDDGLFDAQDNCPTVANPDQSDRDGDNKGDLCDPAPDGEILTVSLSATPDRGDVTDEPLLVEFVATASDTDPQGGTLNFVFYFGDGTNSGIISDSSATHSYDKAGTYEASVVVVNERNKTSQDSTTVTTTTSVVVNPAPIIVSAVLDIQLSGSQAPVTAMFDGSGSSAPEGAIYSFDFGDGANTTGNDAFATHSYPLAGSYTVTMTVTDADDVANSDSATAVISVGSGQQTTAQLVVNPTTVEVGEPVMFDASASIPAEGATITSYHFDFGDGQSETRSVSQFGQAAAVAEHVYLQAGSFSPVVSVTDSQQVVKTSRVAVQVAPVDEPPNNEDSPSSPVRAIAPTSSGGGGSMGLMFLIVGMMVATRKLRKQPDFWRRHRGEQGNG